MPTLKPVYMPGFGSGYVDIEAADLENVAELTATGAVTAADLVATDDLTVGDDATITGAATVGETLGVTGDATVGGTLGVTGALTAASAAVTGAVSGASLVLAGAGKFGLGTPEAVTIATGVATVTRPLVSLAGEGATTDTLDSIVKAGQAAGDLLLIICSGAYTITFDNSATLILGAATRAMAQGSSMLLVATSATVWREVTFLTAAS